jgi:hypothetical protein
VHGWTAGEVIVTAVLVGAVLGVVGILGPPRLSARLAAVAAILALAGLDLVGAVLAARWSTTRQPLALVAGVVVFGILFVVYARGLSFSTLTTVTIGWVVLLQVGVVVIDHVQRNSLPPPDRLVVVAGILALQAYLLVTGPPA